MEGLLKKLMESDAVIEVGFTGPSFLGPLREHGYTCKYAGVDLAIVEGDEREYKDNFFPFSWTNGLKKENIERIVSVLGHPEKVAYVTNGTLYALMNPGYQQSAGTITKEERDGFADGFEFIRYLAGIIDKLPINSQYHLEHILQGDQDGIVYTINGVSNEMAEVFVEELNNLDWRTEFRKLNNPARDSVDYLIAAER